jgi:hypothetical protein
MELTKAAGLSEDESHGLPEADRIGMDGESYMSALPPKADIGGDSWMSAKCHKRTCQLLRLYVDLLLNNNR